MNELLLEMIRSGWPVLTVNDRLARYLSAQFDRTQQQLGLSAWHQPLILSLSAWLDRELSCLPEEAGRLNVAQCQHVWESLIEDDLADTETVLLQVPQTALAARQAHQLLVQYGADFDAGMVAEDHRAFLRWRRRWSELSRRHGWLDPAEMPRRVAVAVVEGRLQLPPGLVLAGFDELTPDLQELRAAIVGQGCEVKHWMPPPAEGGERIRVAAQDPADEVRQCARWIRQILMVTPDAAIGVVAPQLASYQGLLETVLRAELDPQGTVGGEELNGFYNISLGHRLDREGPVHAAMRLLRVGMTLNLDEVSWLLRSPYLGGAETEAGLRAQFDRDLRRKGRTEWSLAQLLRVCRDFARQTRVESFRFGQALETLRDGLHRSGQQMAGHWAERFVTLLRDLGWPGERGLSSREYQAVDRLNRVIGELASLDRVSSRMSRGDALKMLTRLVGAADFQSQGKDTPVQVLGALEAGGLTFDHLWVLGLHDAALPQAPSPNPFIPLPIQRRHRMQRADAEREREFAGQVARRLFHAAPDVVLSWPRQRECSPSRPSPFLASVADGQPLLAESVAPHARIWAARPVLEAFDDSRARALTSRGSFSGGTGIIKDQALCPFRALAHHRLRAERLEAPELGLDGLSRGTLAHTVLELFWRQTGDQAGLLRLDEDQLRNRLVEATDQALDRYEREKRLDLSLRIRQIEQQRLVTLARQWLEVEKERSPFRVKESETSHQIAVGKLTIRTRIDRIDELEGGQLAVIDYKTGRPDPAQWVDDRISEPQLPVYCLGLPRDCIGAVMFAVVRGKRKECGFRGLARDAGGWPGTREQALDALLKAKGWDSFEAILDHWAEALPGLGDAFASGVAMVDPVDPEKACKYCDLTPLCRILELRSGWMTEAEDA